MEAFGSENFTRNIKRANDEDNNSDRYYLLGSDISIIKIADKRSIEKYKCNDIHSVFQEIFHICNTASEINML